MKSFNQIKQIILLESEYTGYKLSDVRMYNLVLEETKGNHGLADKFMTHKLYGGFTVGQLNTIKLKRKINHQNYLNQKQKRALIPS